MSICHLLLCRPAAPSVVTDIKVLRRDNKFCADEFMTISSALDRHFEPRTVTLKFCAPLKAKPASFQVPNAQSDAKNADAAVHME